MNKIRITVWNENVHDVTPEMPGKLMREFYPRGIHNAIAENIACPDFEIRTATLDMPECGLTDDVLAATDVLFWWGHCAHDRVPDALVDKIQKRIWEGMGLIVLHSGHYSKIFRRMLGTSCSLRWREIGEKERLWAVDPAHPIVRGVPLTFDLPHTEMYGEPFFIPDDGKLIFMSWYAGGNVFRSGVTFQRGAGRIFYFSPGHETFPIYNDPNVVKVLSNAARWAAPENPPMKTDCWNMDPALELKS